MVRLKNKKYSLAKKLLVIVVLSSTLITILATSYQLYGLYSRDVSAIDTRLDEIESIHLKSIAHDLWVADEESLNTSVFNLLHLPDMLFVEIKEDGVSKIKIGSTKDSKVIQRSFPLKYFYRGENREIGEMVVQFDLDKVYSRLVEQVVDIVISNSIKTFFVSLIILFLFSRLVTRHLKELSDHISSLTTNNMNDKFVFSKKRLKENEIDELDVLADAFNEMQTSISDGVKLAEVSLNQLSEREAFYSSILDMNPALICVKDVKGHFIFVNRGFEKKFNIKSGEINGKTSDDIFDEQTAKQHKKNDSAVISARIAIEFEEEMSRQIGDENYFSIKFPLFNERNEIYAVGCVSTNVSKLIETQRLLNKKAIEQEEILQSLIDGVITVNENFKIEMINFSAEKILGYRSKILIGKDIDVLMKNSDRKRFRAMKKMIDPGDFSSFIGTSRELYAKRKDGDVFPIQLSINQLPDNEKGEKRLIASFIDLSDIKQKESIIRQSLKMEALGKLTGGIAHDFNNILGVIMGYSELMMMKYPEQEELGKFTYEINHACARGVNLTQKLLAFSSNKKTTEESIDLFKIINDSRDMLQKTMTIRVALDIKVQEFVWPILADINSFEDSLLNICINAMHAMPGGGKVTFDAANIELDESTANDFGVTPGEYVKFSVSDNGCGMLDEVKVRIFDPFFTTKGENGSGLGLSQVYGFMQRSNGAIKVSTEIGVGTQFDLYFPRNKAKVEVENVSDKIEEFSVSGKECVLIVEDEDALRELNMTLLENNGYAVFAAENGIEAIEMLKQHDFSLVLSDLLMPEMDGYALSLHIRANYPDIKIQLLSGFSDEKYHDQLAEDLRMSMLLKPVKSEDLLKQIRVLLDT